MQVVMKMTGLREALALFEGGVADHIKSHTDDYALAGLHGAATIFDRNFRTEGGEVGGWADLAQRTVAEREERGFGGEHPILIRYGGLQDAVTTSLMAARGSGTFGGTDPDGSNVTVQLRVHGGTANVTALGEKASNQVPGPGRPARPYWFLNHNVEQSARDAVVDKLKDDMRAL